MRNRRATSSQKASASQLSSFKRDLDVWVNQATNPDENRIKAATRIFRCKEEERETLNLKGLNLTSLPPQIRDLWQLKNLNLSKNKLTDFPAEIGGLVWLEKLNLASNEITRIPAEIKKLRRLEVFDISSNKITQIPAEIKKLRQLQSLNLNSNRLNQLPDEIVNLTQLRSLHLNSNRLNQLPDEIGNLTQLQILDLRRNQLTSIPESLLTDDVDQSLISRLFNRSRRELNLYLQKNSIDPTEAQRLNSLAPTSGRVLLHFVTQNIVDLIVEEIPPERRLAVRELISNQDGATNGFSEFILRCQKTAGWKNNRAEMIKALASITDAMIQNDSLKERCVTIANESLGECADRISVGYIHMLFAKDAEHKPVAEMNLQQLTEYARKEMVVKFLNRKADERIAELTRGIDEIETYLAYLQAAPLLGVNIPASSMLYRKHYSNVSEDDLKNAVDEFCSKPLNQRIAEGIYEEKEAELKKHPAIKPIITAVADKYSADIADISEGEGSSDYLERVLTAQTLVKNETIKTISEVLDKPESLEEIIVALNSATQVSATAASANITSKTNPQEDEIINFGIGSEYFFTAPFSTNTSDARISSENRPAEIPSPSPAPARGVFQQVQRFFTNLSCTNISAVANLNNSRGVG